MFCYSEGGGGWGGFGGDGVFILDGDGAFTLGEDFTGDGFLLSAVCVRWSKA
jgi:hypothetical protein